MRFSLRLNNDLRVDDYVRFARTAEDAGFDQFWVSNDLFLRSAPVILTAIASETSRIEIGTCILNPYTINPAEIAMMAATLDEYCGGRFNLGLAAGAADFLAWVGLEHGKALTSLKETVRVLRLLFEGDRAEIEGFFLQWGSEAYLRFESLRSVPIYLGAMSPNMLRTIGEVADGGLPLLFPPEHYQNVIPLIEAGATSGGRSVDDIDVAACIWCSVDEDEDAAREPLKRKIAYYGHALSPMILSQLGLSHDDFKLIQRKVEQDNDLDGAAALVTDEMMRIGIAGRPKVLIERLEGLAAMGVRHISFGPPLGSDPLRAIETIGRTVIPYFRG